MKLDVAEWIKGLQKNLSGMDAWRSLDFDPARIYGG
jgi:hypothetical protein